MVGALKAGPMRSEQIEKALGLEPRELPRVLKHGVQVGRIKYRGEKRSRTYRVA